MRKAEIKTADGKPMKPRMKVYAIYTRDGGRTWQTGMEQEVHDVRRGSLPGVRLAEPCFTLIGGDLPGDNRIYSNEKAAEAECKRRNKLSKKK